MALTNKCREGARMRLVETGRSREMMGATQGFEPFVCQWAVPLTTYKRDGTPVGTPVVPAPQWQDRAKEGASS
jgi:hypothetical protein